jgi:hypothetical protein
MMFRRRFLAFTLLLVLSGCGKSDSGTKPAEKEAESAPGLTLSSEQVKSLGITTAPATAAQYRQRIDGYGVVTSLDTVAQADAEILTAEAAATQSRAAAARALSLASGEEAAVSREVVETAQSKAAADQAALMLAQRKAEAAFGRGAPWHDAKSRQAIMARLASGKTVLVRVTFPLGSLGGATPGSLQISRLGADAKTWTAHTIWEAPADPTFPGRGFYTLVDGSDLVQNEHIAASVPLGVAQPGVVVPAGALVYGDSEAFVYLQTRPGSFRRVQIDTSRSMDKGYFLAAGGGIAPGQSIVVNGAGLLLARETNPSTEAPD